jgi:hypothetical protein
MKRDYYGLVKSNFSFPALKEICCAEFKDFAKFGGTLYGKKEEDQYYFKDNGSNVLAVAHLDSVAKHRFCGYLSHPAEPRIYSPSLDDRLGAYVILDLLPKLGITPDILLTNNEETGATTAKKFQTEKKYNWMFSFDRMGDDVVMYQYKDIEWEKLLEKFDFTKVYQGSFSCIASLEHLGCIGYNFGVGYHDYHSEWAYANVEELFSQVAKFTRFYQSLKDRKMEYVPKPQPQYGRYYNGSYGNYRSSQEWNGLPDNYERIGNHPKKTVVIDKISVKIYCEPCKSLVSLALINKNGGECPFCQRRSEELTFPAVD